MIRWEQKGPVFKMKRYNELAFTDDFMFCKVLTEHPELCKKLAELFTGRKVRKLGEIRDQLTVEILRTGKGVRFDVWFEDDADTMYDFEMQTTVRKNLPKRTRYYQSMLDVRRLKTGNEYTKLPDSYIIFICMEDPFARGCLRYTFKNICSENHSLVLGDGAVKIFINASGTNEGGNPGDAALLPFLNYLRGRNAEDALTKEIESAVQAARDDEEGMVMYMTLEEHYRDHEKIGEARGEVRGIKKGAAEESRKNRDALAENLLKEGICKTRDEADARARSLLNITDDT